MRKKKDELVKIQPEEFLIEMHSQISDKLDQFCKDMANMIDRAPSRYEGLPYVFKQSAALAYIGAVMTQAGVSAATHHLGGHPDNETERDVVDDKRHAAEVVMEVFSHYFAVRCLNDKTMDHNVAITFALKEKQ